MDSELDRLVSAAAGRNNYDVSEESYSGRVNSPFLFGIRRPNLMTRRHSFGGNSSGGIMGGYGGIRAPGTYSSGSKPPIYIIPRTAPKESIPETKPEGEDKEGKQNEDEGSAAKNKKIAPLAV